ncbi:Hypothetical protein, putative [Bodo saltans]|uniref:Uncharacterized protein n=1 Tax=Bodo saltans TaxID=75058 RepID=A0A0S4J3K4_BODSA|nr:Hypothetical protein, putative [Bodo saltans]|eukprot:CUG08033.1 Hypothetical protein, putative [Bodo saltans]
MNSTFLSSTFLQSSGEGSGDHFSLPALVLPKSKRQSSAGNTTVVPSNHNNSTANNGLSSPRQRRRESSASNMSSTNGASTSLHDAEEDNTVVVAQQPRRPTSTSSTLPRASPSPRVMRFSSDEVQMYAQWFSADLPLVRALVIECGGDRGLILASLQEHQRQQLPPHSPSPPLIKRRSSARRLSMEDGQGSPLPPRPPSQSMQRASSAARLSPSGRQLRRSSETAQLSSSGVSVEAPASSTTASPPPAAVALKQDASLEATYSIGALFRMAEDCVEEEEEKRPSSSQPPQRLSARLSLIIMQPLLKAEQALRRQLEDQERAEVLRLWRSSQLCAIQVAATQTQALESSEKMYRDLLTASEARQAGVLCVSFDAGGSELSQREALVHEAFIGLSKILSDALHTFHNTSRNALVRAERSDRNYLTEVVFIAGLQLTHVMKREVQRRDELWHERLLSLHLCSTRMASDARDIHEKHALVLWMISFEAHYRESIAAYEVGYRAAMRTLAEHTNRLSIAYVVEPWARNIHGVLQQSERLRIASLASWAVKTSIPFCRREALHRVSIIDEEAEEAAALSLRVQYHQMKLRHKQRRSITASSSTDVTTSNLFFHLEAARRRRVEQQYECMVKFLNASLGGYSQ